MTPGDILGHEPMGIVEAVGSGVTNLHVGDRVVVPFNISCGHCFMCDQGLQSQCETTQVCDQGCGAALFGYTKLYGQVPGGQAELLRVPHAVTALLPNGVAEKLMRKTGADRLAALHMAFDLVRRVGTASIVGVYGAMTDPMPMMTMFDKQVHVRMGQANVRRWVDDIMALLVDDDPLGVDTFATHHVPLSGAPAAYEMFQSKSDGAIKVVLNP